MILSKIFTLTLSERITLLPEACLVFSETLKMKDFVTIIGKRSMERDLFCGASKGFMKALKSFIKPFQAPQRIVKIRK